MVLFSLGTGLETGGHRTRHLWSHSPGRQQPMNQEDHLWHKMGGRGEQEKEICEYDHHGGREGGTLLEPENTGGPCQHLRGLHRRLLKRNTGNGKGTRGKRPGQALGGCHLTLPVPSGQLAPTPLPLPKAGGACRGPGSLLWNRRPRWEMEGVEVGSSERLIPWDTGAGVWCGAEGMLGASKEQESSRAAGASRASVGSVAFILSARRAATGGFSARK